MAINLSPTLWRDIPVQSGEDISTFQPGTRRVLRLLATPSVTFYTLPFSGGFLRLYLSDMYLGSMLFILSEYNLFSIPDPGFTPFSIEISPYRNLQGSLNYVVQEYVGTVSAADTTSLKSFT